MIKYYFFVFSIISMCNFIELFNMDLDVESVTGLFMDYIDETLKASFAQRSVDNIEVSDVYLNPRELINKSTELFVSLLDERMRALNNVKESVVKSYTVPQFEPTTILCKKENSGESNFNFQSKVALSRFCVARHPDSLGQQVFLTSEFYDTASKSLIENPALKWQYFCSERGIWSIYPSSKFEFVPDCRTRPWYIISVTQTKKEYVFILDRSGSMNTFINGVKLFDLAKEAIKVVIGSLHPEDKFAVVIASDDFITPGNFTFSNCFDTNFALAIGKNAALIGKFLDELDATGGSSFTSALSRAFSYFKKENQTENKTETVKQILVMVSDAQINENPDLVVNRTRSELQELNDDVQLVFFGVGNADFSLFRSLLQINSNSKKQDEIFQLESIADIIKKLLFFYKRYEDSIASISKPSWTLPYIDAFGLGVVFTLTSPVFDEGNLLGVLGIDISVQEIINELDVVLFNPYNYLFLTTFSGYLLYHPSFPVISTDDIFATVTLFEQGKQFAEGLAQILEGSAEYIIINASDSSHSIPFGGDIYHGSVMEHKPKQYFLKKVGQYPFIVGLSIGNDSFQLFNVTYSQPGTILHNRLDLVPPSNICQHLGQDASIDLASVFFTSLGFKDPLHYVAKPLSSQVIKEIVSYLEGSPENPQEVKAFIRGNVALTGILQELWKLDDDENAPLRRNSFLRFVAMFSGVVRFYPGSQIPDNFDPTARAWFRQISSYSNLSFVAVSPYLDVTSNTPVITVGRTLRHKKKEKFPLNRIVGVMGMDISLFVFNENFLDIYPKCGENTRYRCYLFDLGGFPLAVSYFRPNDWFDQDRRQWENHITELEPAISRILIEKDVMRVLKCQNLAIGEIGIAYHIYLEDNQEFSGFYRQSFFDVFNFKIVQIPDSNVVLLIRTLPIVSCFPGTFSCPCRKSQCYSTEKANSFCQCPCYYPSSLYIPCNNSYNTFENDIPPCVPVPNIRLYQAPAVEESKIRSWQDEESRNQPCYDVNFRTIFEVLDKGFEWVLIMMSISILVIPLLVFYIKKNHKEDLDYDYDETNAVYWSQTSKTGLSKGSYTSFDATVRLHTLKTTTNIRKSMPHSSGVTGFKNKIGLFGRLKRTLNVSAPKTKTKAEILPMLDIDKTNSGNSYLNQYESATSTLNPVKSLWKRIKRNTMLFNTDNQSKSSFLTLKTQTSTTYKSARTVGSSTTEYVDVAEDDDASDDDYENAKQINDISDANLYEDTSVGP